MQEDEPHGEPFPINGHDGLRQLRDYIAGCEWESGCHPCTWWQPGMAWGGPGAAPATPDPATLARLAALPGLWSPWEEAVTRALQRTHLALQRRAFWTPREFVVKSWAVVAHTASGRQVERVLVATDRALYRCAFSYRDGRLGEARRTEWANYAQVHVGPFRYTRDAGAWSLGDWVLQPEVDSTYGWRIFNRRAAVVGSSNPLSPGLTFLQESVVDTGVFLTGSALVPPHVARAGPAAALAFERDTAAEVALLAFGLMLSAAAGRADMLAPVVCTALPSLPYRASAPLLASLHHKLGFSRESHDNMRPGLAAEPAALAALGSPPDVSPWLAPSAGELPKSGKLLTRRCT